MSDLLNYRGYEGSVSYSADDNCLYGRVLHIRSVISYGGDSVHELKQMFEAAIDDYLELCAERGIEPEKPYKGNFNVRLSPQKHYQAVQTARRLNISLNELVCRAVDDFICYQDNHQILANSIETLSQHIKLTSHIVDDYSFELTTEQGQMLTNLSLKETILSVKPRETENVLH